MLKILPMESKNWTEIMRKTEDDILLYHQQNISKADKIDAFQKKLKEDTNAIQEITLKCGSMLNVDICIRLCIYYGVSYFRPKGMRKTEMKVMSTIDFVDNILWPEVLHFSSMVESIVVKVEDHFYEYIKNEVLKQ